MTDINPFSIPPNVDSLTQLKQAQAAAATATAHRSNSSATKPHHRTQSSHTTTANSKPTSSRDSQSANTLARSGAHALTTTTTAGHSYMTPSSQPAKQKLDLQNFVQQKRQLFLLSLSLQTKQNEIDKLNKKCEIKESALSKSEQLLETDIKRFDEFLQSNDRAVQQSIHDSENATKLKNNQINEIKKLNLEIQKLDNENHKYHENLQIVDRYKHFLLSVQPMTVQQAGDLSQTAADASHDQLMFTRPEQLFDIFTQLEEKNLFLIENVQETEQALEVLRHKYTTSEQQIGAQIQLLQAQINDLNHKISVEQEKYNTLSNDTHHSHTHSHTAPNTALMSAVRTHVQSVYHACGYENVNVETLDMLSSVEQWLEKLIDQINTIDIVKVENAEKQQNLYRRNIIRQNKKVEFERAYEARLQKSTERANSKIVKNLSKIPMKRSQINRKKVNNQETVIVDTEVEAMKQFFT